MHWSAPTAMGGPQPGPTTGPGRFGVRAEAKASFPPHASFVAPVGPPRSLPPPTASPVLASLSMGHGVPSSGGGFDGPRPSTSGTANPSRSQIRNDVLRHRSRPGSTSHGRRPGTTSGMESSSSGRSKNSEKEFGFSVVESSDGSFSSVPVDNRDSARAKSAGGAPRAPWGSGAGRGGLDAANKKKMAALAKQKPRGKGAKGKGGDGEVALLVDQTEMEKRYRHPQPDTYSRVLILRFSDRPREPHLPSDPRPIYYTAL